jgi:uncharacterized protein YcgI (DUF1989 family)
VVELRAGQVLDVIDVEGEQVGDLVAYRPQDPAEYLSPAHTTSSLMKLVPEVGDALYSNHRTPLLEVLRDDVGSHDLVVPCCDPERYVQGYGVHDHPSCLAALQDALGDRWEVRGELAWNVFMDNRLEDGRIVTHAADHPAGSTISLRALVDLVVAMSACPQDLSPCNNFHPTAMAFEVR